VTCHCKSLFIRIYWLLRHHVDATQRRIPMVIAIIIGLLALFSLISFALDTDDWRERRYSPRDQIIFWMRFGNR